MTENLQPNIEGWEEWSDEYGTYQRKDNVTLVVSRTQKWHDENPQMDPEPPEPTPLEMMTDYLVDVDYRLTLVELGLV